MQRTPSLGLAALVLLAALAGCVGLGAPGEPAADATRSPTSTVVASTDSTTDATDSTTDATDSTTDSTATTSSPTTEPAPANATARERALAAEEARVRRALNVSNVSATVGAYGAVEATVLERADGTVRVRVVMSYSYEYDCDGRSGAVDGLTTETVYRVTDESAELQRVVSGVRLLC